MVRRRVVGAEQGDPGGVTVCRGVEQRAQNGGVAGGDHGDGRPPWDMISGKKLLLRAVNSGGWSVWGGYNREQSCWTSPLTADLFWGAIQPPFFTGATRVERETSAMKEKH